VDPQPDILTVPWQPETVVTQHKQLVVLIVHMHKSVDDSRYSMGGGV
jgi:hypothetical protein